MASSATRISPVSTASMPSIRESENDLRRQTDVTDDGALSDETSDEEDSNAKDHLVIDTSNDHDVDADSIIGISIGQDQDLMRCPTTPAATKSQALESSMTYFTAGEQDEALDHVEPFHDSAPKHGSFQHAENRDSASANVVWNNDSPSAALSSRPVQSEDGKQKPERRTGMVGSILSSVNNRTRQRSSSGSALFDNIRKIFPNMTSNTQSASNSTDKLEQSRSTPKVLGPAGPGYAREGPIPTEQQKRSNRSFLSPQNSGTNHESNKVSELDTENTLSRPATLRRATSDQSLYIRRAPTGASAFDDYNNFSDVSDMVNSRFKAITDSLQDSGFRMPKMPSLSRGDRSSTTSTKLESTTRQNTNANAGVSGPTKSENYQSGQTSVPDVNSNSRHPVIKDALSQMSGDLIVMGGYRGSVLREAQPPNRQLWVPVKVGLNLRKADLEVGLTREDELRMTETIVPDGTLSHIGPVDICRRLLKKCRKHSNAKNGTLRIHDHGYDWRLSPDLLRDRFISFVEGLPCNQKSLPSNERGAWVIAHSLGGLITRSAINQRPELFAGVVYAGTPQNCVNILGPLRNGDDVLFSSRVLTAQVNFTLRTSFVLLPQNGRCFINKQTGEHYKIDFFDVKSWDEYHLSPCIRGPLHRQTVEKRRSTILGGSSDLPNRTSKSSSWFTTPSSREEYNNDNVSNRSTAQTMKDKANNAKDEIADTADTAMNGKPDSPFAPSLADGQQHKPSIATNVTIPLPAAVEYLSRTLASVLEFKQGLSHKPDFQARNAYPPVSVLFAKNTPTVYGAFVESREAIKYDDAFSELAFAAGDGVVLASAAQLPAGYRCVRNGRVESERGHVGLLGDIEGVGKCLLAITDARRRGVGSGFPVKGTIHDLPEP